MPTAPFRLRPSAWLVLLALPALARGQAATAPTALPTGASVASGAVTLQQDAATLRVHQASDKAIVNWQTFNIGRDAAVQFVQPGANATILNRVLDGPSDIAGRLGSNGRVYLVNPNGVLFGASARVDVGSLVVAAGSLSDISFLYGVPQIAARARVDNAGTISAADGGSVVLAGAGVGNSGTIGAPGGAITLAAGDTVRVNLSSDGLIQAQVTLAAPHAMVANSGTLDSAGGHIALAAAASANGAGAGGLVIDSGIVRAGAVRSNGGTVSLVGAEVQASGSIDVSSVEGAAGKVDILGDLQAGSVRLDAAIDARGATAGGIVDTSAARVQAGPHTRVSTRAANGPHGTWRIDPQDYSIGDAPGDDISGASLSLNLGLGNVTIDSVAGVRSGAGDIRVNAPVSWESDSTLVLNAQNSILFASGPILDPANPNAAARANLSAGGANAGLVMNFGNRYHLGENKLTLSGAHPRILMNGVPFTAINDRSPDALDKVVRANPGGNYVLTTDLDASGTAFANDGLGWEPLGNAATPFSGQLHGFGHVIGNLAINRSTANVGLIGVLTGTVRDLGLVDPDITGGNQTGALVGTVQSANASILNTYVAGGSVRSSAGYATAGGLVGALRHGPLAPGHAVIDSSYASAVFVDGNAEGTGLVGQAGTYGAYGIRNSFYNASDEQHTERALGAGAIFGTQFGAWLAGGRKLDIADYAQSLPYDAQSGSYGLGTVQGMRDLLGFANAGVNVRLTGDLDLAEEISLFLPTFNGQLDGAGHTIAHLHTDYGARIAYAGLVGVNTGTIRNLNLAGVRINGWAAGGVAGANLGTVENVAVSGEVNGTDSVGGLVGFQLAGGALRDSVSTADVTGQSSLGGVIGDFDAGTLRNTHYDADAVRITYYSGGAARSRDATPVLSMGALRSAQYADWIANGRRLDIADYADVLPRDAASGAYLVSNLAGMNAMLGFVDDPARTFRLNADIDLAPAPGLFLPYLMGTLDGNGHRIGNLRLVAPGQQYLGLVGVNYGTVRNLGASNVSVDGYYYVGGLVGRNQPGARIDTSFSSGTVLSRFAGVGGLVGANFGAIANTYSSAGVAGDNGFGAGLVGSNYGAIGNSLATGSVDSGNGGNGGLVGNGSGSVANSFWNIGTSGIATSQGGTGKTGAELQSVATYTGWDFASTWRMVDGTPSLRIFSAGQYDLVVDALDLRLTYGAGPVRAGDLALAVSGLQGGDTLDGLGTLNYGGDGIGAIDAGSYSVLPFGLVSSKYDIVYQPGTVTIDKAPLTLAADNRSKVYGDADPALGFSVGGLQYADTAAVLSGVVLSAPTGAAAGAGQHAISISGGSAANYMVASTTPGLLTVAKRPLALSADNQAKVYGDADPVLRFSVAGLQYADTAAVLSGVVLSAPTGAAAGAGQHAISIGGGSAANYTVGAYAPGVLTVARRPLLLTADNKTITLDGSLIGSPTGFTFSASGFAYTDTIDLVDAGLAVEGLGSAVAGSTLPIVFVNADAGPNYAASTVDGIATVAGVSVEPPPLPPPVQASLPAQGLIQSLMQAPAALNLPRVPDATMAGSVALAASLAGGATPQRKELFAQAGDAITRNPAIGSLKTCGEDELADCIARPRMAYQAQVLEDTGGSAPAMQIRRKLALVIGNNDYRSPLARLEGAGRDAQAVAAVLRRQGYQVEHLADADRSTMIASLNRLIRTSEPDDSVLVFYAGHGYIHPGSSVGYWLPAGAGVDDPRGWLSNIDIARFLANMPARQLLLVSDSCFSGALTREGVAAEARAGMSRDAILMRRSVVALSSGGEEVVADSALDGHSPFTWHLLRQLENAQGEIPARDMLLSIRDKVSQSSDGQVPAYGIILSSGHASGGEYLLNPKSN